VGLKVNALPLTFTSPGTFGSMLNALDVLAGSIGWSNVTTTGAEMTCSCPRSGLMLTTVGGKGARVGVGAGSAVAAVALAPEFWAAPVAVAC
jgi:hypothetical protein